MSQIVGDADAATHLFNWHFRARDYANALRGPEMVLSSMSVAEFTWAPLRPVVGALAAD